MEPILPSFSPRSPVASLAARLMAEEGIGDYAVAKRKAASMLHLPTGVRLPENSEIESELRAYLRLFQKDEQPKILADLRRIACDFMAIMHHRSFTIMRRLGSDPGCRSRLSLLFRPFPSLSTPSGEWWQNHENPGDTRD